MDLMENGGDGFSEPDVAGQKFDGREQSDLETVRNRELETVKAIAIAMNYPDVDTYLRTNFPRH